MDLTNAIPKTTAPGSGLAAFGTAVTAPEFTPLPPGIYLARVVKGEYATTLAGAESYRIRFEITDGEHTGSSLLRVWTFGDKALSYTQRDLARFGLYTPEQLLSPFPDPAKEYRVRLTVAKKKDDGGVERNDIKKIELLSVTDSPAAAFLLPPPPTEGGAAV